MKFKQSLFLAFCFSCLFDLNAAQISGDQIIDGAITNIDISTSAEIDLTKIANDDKIVVTNGANSIILENDMSANGFKLNNMATNTDSAGAITYGQLTDAVATLNSTISSNQVINLQATDFTFNETPSGTVNGANSTFVLANTPTTSKVLVFRNGLLQLEGGGEDYTISGATITFVAAPSSGSKLRVVYIKP